LPPLSPLNPFVKLYTKHPRGVVLLLPSPIPPVARHQDRDKNGRDLRDVERW
jgi:hypothetical protein